MQQACQQKDARIYLQRGVSGTASRSLSLVEDHRIVSTWIGVDFPSCVQAPRPLLDSDRRRRVRTPGWRASGQRPVEGAAELIALTVTHNRL